MISFPSQDVVGLRQEGTCAVRSDGRVVGAVFLEDWTGAVDVLESLRGIVLRRGLLGGAAVYDLICFRLFL